MPPLHLKITYVEGLRDIVLHELGTHPEVHILYEDKEGLYVDFIPDIHLIKNLKSVSRVYAVVQDPAYNPSYISKHKSIVGKLVDTVLADTTETFKTFKITCAGSDSKEVQDIGAYLTKTYALIESEEADVKISIIKLGNIWEVGIQMTRRPLTVRSYKVENIQGGINPPIAYAMNSLADLDRATSYLNVFSGSATLLIEAASMKPGLKLVGFDSNKKTISLAIHNIQKAGFIRNIQLKAFDIFDKPDLGKYDVIAADLPFGMLISKNEDLDKLYKCFVEYSENTLNPRGRLVVYTSEYETLKKILDRSKFTITKTLDLKFLTSVNAYLYPKVFVCELR